MRPVLFVLYTLLSSIVYAGRISGTVSDTKGNILPFASITVKQTTIGTVSNNEGKYFLDLQPGEYTIVAHYVGFQQQEKKITVGDGNIVLNFQLSLLNLSMKEVVVKPGGEDPAYEIIRNAIRKREYYLDQLDKFQCQVYIKGQLRLRDFPKKFLGETIDFEDGDTSKRKMIYLSETIANYSVDKPRKSKVEVISTKVSGQSDGYGFSAPQIISFYENNIQIGRNLNPRGFVSPIANNALNFYRYKFEGSYVEDDIEINRIQVIPKRKYEPLFMGYINITENDWRIHSLQLELTKESQMQFVDTLRIDQLYVPLNKDVWVIKTQVIYPAAKIFKFDAYGSFVNVYSEFNIDPAFPAGFFDNTILKFEEGSNKKPSVYWDTIRPVELQLEEIVDYRKKDSIERVRNSPEYLDSVDRKRNKVSAVNILLTGITLSKQRRQSTFSMPSGSELVKYNTVEGLAINPALTWFKNLDTITQRKSLAITSDLRYGFSNRHFNAFATANYTFGKKIVQTISISGGKRIFQFYNNSAQSERGATLSALFFERNWRKVYEGWYGRVRYERMLGEGFRWSISLQYQDRLPLENTSTYTFIDRKNISFTPNYPENLMSKNFVRHQAFTGTASISWRPGTKYIEFPDRRIAVGSRYPTFTFTYVKGFRDILGSDVDYDRWRFAISDHLNLRLAGRFSYHVSTGGFLTKAKVEIPDYYHLNSNQSIFASEYLNSFQVVRHYTYSNTARLFTQAHIEHHFNGLITNKIPVFRKLNWHIVGGSNMFYVNSSNHYTEVFGGLENVFKILRIDYVFGRHADGTMHSAVRVGIRGITGHRNQDN